MMVSMAARESDEINKTLRDGLLLLGLTPPHECVEAFSLYLAELKKWNKACGLTSIRNDRDIIIKHFFDSLLYLPYLPRSPIRVADVGTGGGFPGIPIKIVRPDVHMVLIEAAEKKTIFLRHVIKRLHVDDVDVIAKRIESVRIPDDVTEPVDVALTRAVFGVREFFSKAAHIVKDGGMFILGKGPKVHEELKEAEGIPCEVHAARLPLTSIERYLVVMRKSEGRG